MKYRCKKIIKGWKDSTYVCGRPGKVIIKFPEKGTGIFKCGFNHLSSVKLEELEEKSSLPEGGLS